MPVCVCTLYVFVYMFYVSLCSLCVLMSVFLYLCDCLYVYCVYMCVLCNVYVCLCACLYVYVCVFLYMFRQLITKSILIKVNLYRKVYSKNPQNWQNNSHIQKRFGNYRPANIWQTFEFFYF